MNLQALHCTAGRGAECLSQLGTDVKKSRDPFEEKLVLVPCRVTVVAHSDGWTEELRGRVARLLGSKLLVSLVRKYP